MDKLDLESVFSTLHSMIANIIVKDIKMGDRGNGGGDKLVVGGRETSDIRHSSRHVL